MEEFLHYFGVRAKAQEQELHRWLVESQVTHADLVKDVHEICQFTILKLATCKSRLDPLEGTMQSCRTEVAQTLANLEALEKCVGVAKDLLVHVGLTEVRADIQKRMRRYLLFQRIGKQQLSSYKDGFRGGKCPELRYKQ